VSIGAAVIALAAFLYYRRRRSRPTAPVPAGDRALAAIDALETNGESLADANRYHTRLSQIIRAYLEERFALQVSQRTTEEFFHDLPRRQILDAPQEGLLHEVIGRCDLAKFAGMRLPPEECRCTGSRARAFIEQTKETERL
jgi:hypothetical protein